MTRLPRLDAKVPIVDSDGKPTLQFQRNWQQVVEAIEAIDARVTALEP